MKHNRKTITPEMLRQCFGPGAEISKRLGRFIVRTRDGGEVKITDRRINHVHVSRDAHAGCARLAGQAWGGGKVHGPADFKLAALAWGESEGVNLRVKERGAIARAVVAALIVVIGCNVIDPVVCGVIALLVWLLMKWAAKRQAERENEQMSFPYPRSTDAREASDEDLRKGGWL